MRSPCTATKSSPCSPQLEKARTQQRRPNAAINKLINKLINLKQDKKTPQSYTEPPLASKTATKGFSFCFASHSCLALPQRCFAFQPGIKRLCEAMTGVKATSLPLLRGEKDCLHIWNPEWNHGILVPKRVLRSLSSFQTILTLITLIDNPNISSISNISWILCECGHELKCVFVKKEQTVLCTLTSAVTALFTASLLGSVTVWVLFILSHMFIRHRPCMF